LALVIATIGAGASSFRPSSPSSGIKDEATAQAAVPGVTKASSEFDQLAGLFNQLPPDARKAVVEAFAAIKPSLDQTHR